VTLESFFRQNQLPYNSESIIVTVTTEESGEVSPNPFDKKQQKPISPLRPDEVVTPFDRFEGYRFVARSVVEHIP